MQPAPRPSVSSVLEAHARSQRAAFGEAPARRPTEPRVFAQPTSQAGPFRLG